MIINSLHVQTHWSDIHIPYILPQTRLKWNPYSIRGFNQNIVQIDKRFLKINELTKMQNQHKIKLRNFNQLDFWSDIMRKTKIICTIGPASENEEVLTQMCLAGMNVARLNFSHGTYPEHENKINLIKRVREKLGLPIAILLDTKGPEYRIGNFVNGKVQIAEGASFTFTTDEVEGDETKVSVNYKNLHNELHPGDTVSANNGMVIFEVQQVEGHDIHCICKVGGTLSNRKSMSFPNKVMSGPYLSEQDKADIIFGIQHGVDFVAASFVSSAQDVLDVRKLLDDNGGSDIEIVAKIENRAGVDNVESICENCSGVMIARGDLGVEIP